MKKLILLVFLSFLLVPIAKADTLYGFLDGSLYDTSGNLRYICFLDNSCVDVNNNVTTRQALGLTPLEIVSNVPSQSIQPTQTVSNSVSSPVVSGVTPVLSPITLEADPSFTATSVKNGSEQAVLGQWIVSNNTNAVTDRLRVFASFNFNNQLLPTEGFKDLSLLKDGFSLGSIDMLGSTGEKTWGSFQLVPNSSNVLSIVGNPLFNSSNSVSINSYIRKDQHEALTPEVIGTSLTVIP